MIDTIVYLTSVAIVEAARAGLEVEIDRSRQSEAVYVRVERQGFWYGLRIAAHEPHHLCSADCEQFIVPHTVESVSMVAAEEARLRKSVLNGGRVVADGAEVAEALLEEVRRQRDGVCRAGAHATLWKWQETTLTWQLTRVKGRVPDALQERVLQQDRPAGPPEIRLTPTEQCAIRHRLNLRAAWACEEYREWQTSRRVASAEEGRPNGEQAR